jgi:large subunit ribosomal protein L10
MKLEEKKERIKRLEETVKGASGIYLVDFRGITANEIKSLRTKMREEEIKFQIARNIILTHTFRNLGLDELNQFLEGPTGICVSSDSLSPSKVLEKFSEKTGKLRFKGGLIDGRLCNEEDLSWLARIPPKEVLYQRLVSSLSFPIASLTLTLSGIIRNLIYVLRQISEKKENGK